MKKVKVTVIKVKNASFDINFQMKIADILSSSNKVEKACGIGSKSRVYRCNNKASLIMILNPLIKLFVLLQK